LCNLQENDFVPCYIKQQLLTKNKLMNKFALLPVFMLLLLTAKAQDRIISIQHDTIDCTIVSINNESIRYELKNKDGSVTGRFMNVSQVAEYTRSPQQENSLKPQKLKIKKQVKALENPWSLGMNIGGSTMPWYFDNIQSLADMPDYYNRLKTGFHINTSAHYMLTGFLGVGAEYSFFETSAGGNLPTQYITSMFLMVSEKYHQYMNYLGPSVLLVQHPDSRRKFILSESLSAGVLFFRLEDQSNFPNIDNSGYTDIKNNTLLTANSLSAKFGLTAEYRLFRNISVGLGGDYIWCSLKKANLESRGSNNTSSSTKDQALTNAMKITRIDYSIVLRYHF